MTVNYRDELAKVVNNGFNVRDDLKDKSIDEIRDAQVKLPFSVCIMNLFGDLNVANIIRSSVIFGASKVFLAGRSNYDRRGSVGAQNYIDIERLNYMQNEMEVDWLRVIRHIVNTGFLPVLIEQGGDDISTFFESDSYKELIQFYVNGPCFIFGNEGLGLPVDMLDRCNGDFPIVSINQFGVMRSLNVSVAAGIIMHEFVRNI